MTRRAKIMILSTTEWIEGQTTIGGTERVVVALAHALTQKGCRVRTVFPMFAQSAAMLAWSRDHGVVAETSSALLPCGAQHTIKALIALWRFVHRSRPDVVNLHYPMNFISLKDVLAVRLAGRHRCVVTMHHPLAWDDVNTRKRYMTYLAGLLVDVVVVNSRATEQVLRQARLPADKVVRIPIGVAAPARMPSREEARDRLGLPRDAFVISSLARIVRYKGIANLIDAAAQTHDPQGKLMVVVAGEGPEREYFQQYADVRLGQRACFLGRISDTDDLYAASDVFALPSELEGFGVVFVEAAYHGIPSIGTDVGGIPDAIADGETGLLVPVGDVAALTQALEQLRDDASLRQRLGEAAYRRAHSEFTEEHMADRYSKLF